MWLMCLPVRRSSSRPPLLQRLRTRCTQPVRGAVPANLTCLQRQRCPAHEANAISRCAEEGSWEGRDDRLWRCRRVSICSDSTRYWKRKMWGWTRPSRSEFINAWLPPSLMGHSSFRDVQNYDRGELAVSYRGTGWVWEITGSSSGLKENYRSF